MDPVCFYIGSRAVYWYGIMVAAGFLACVAHLTILGIREGRPPSFGSDLAFWIILSGIIGARIAYVVANINYYWQDPLAIIRVDQGGLIYYGGFIGAFIAGIIFARIKKLNILALADYIVSALPLGHAFGRIGCFLNGCCYGSATPSGFMLGIVFPGESVSRYPTQIFSAVALLFIFAVLRIWQKKRHFVGEIFLGYGLLYSIKRFGMEFFRGDNPKIIHGLTISQLISIAIFVVCSGLFIYRMLKWKRSLKSA